MLYGKDPRRRRLQGLEQALNGSFDAEAGDIPAKRHRLAAIKAFRSWLREEEAYSPHHRRGRHARRHLHGLAVAVLALEHRTHRALGSR